MTTAAVTAPLALAVVLALSAVAKVRYPGSTLSSMKQLRLPGWVATRRLALAIPRAELALALALVLAPAGSASVVTSASALVLMCAYWALIARGLTMSPRPRCGCFGRLGSPVRPLTLVRNTLLVLLAGAALALGVTGQATLDLLRGATGEQWSWLLAVTTAAGAAALVMAIERPARPRSDPDRRDPLDLARVPIPHQVLLESDGTPRTLHELAAERPQLLVWVTAPHQRSRPAHARDGFATITRWRQELPALDVRLVTCVAPAEEAGWLVDHAGSMFTSLGLALAPAAVLLGTDGLLAGGPVSGDRAVEDLVDGIRDVPATAPGPGAPAGG